MTDEHVATGLVDRPARALVEVTGQDAVEYLQGQVTNDVGALSPGQGCYAALLNPKGKILSDCRILMVDDQRLWVDAEPVAREVVLKELRMYKIGRAVDVEDRSDERRVLSLVGAESASTVESLGGAPVPVEVNSFVGVSITGADVLIVRSPLGCDVFVASSDSDHVRSVLLDHGATPVDEAVADNMRIELGIPRFGIDMSDENLPGEAGIVERAVSFTKGCYVGQEPVARMFHKGHPNRVLRGLRLSAPVDSGASLSREDKQVGKIGSTGLSATFGNIGLAIVRREVEPGEQLNVDSNGATATVVELPFR